MVGDGLRWLESGCGSGRLDAEAGPELGGRGDLCGGLRWLRGELKVRNGMRSEDHAGRLMEERCGRRGLRGSCRCILPGGDGLRWLCGELQCRDLQRLLWLRCVEVRRLWLSDGRGRRRLGIQSWRALLKSNGRCRSTERLAQWAEVAERTDEGAVRARLMRFGARLHSHEDMTASRALDVHRAGQHLAL